LSAALKSHGLLNIEGETVLRPKGVLSGMNSHMEMIKNLQPVLETIKNIQPSLQMVKNLHSVSDAVSTMGAASLAASQATSALQSVMGIYCPTIE